LDNNRKILVGLVVVLGLLGFVSNLINENEVVDNNQEATFQEPKTGKISIKDTWWSIGDNNVTIIECKNIVTAYIQLEAIEGNVSGDIGIILKGENPKGTDPELSSKNVTIELEKGETKIIKLFFSTLSIKDSNLYGLYCEVEGDCSWKMDGAYPPRLELESNESETEPETVEPANIHIDAIAECVNIIDGDTFELSNGDLIRLADVDAPEQGHTGFQESFDALKSLIFGKAIYLDIDDIYGTTLEGEGDRYVCVVYLGNGLNINLELLNEGYASLYDHKNEFDPETWSLINILDIDEAENYTETKSKSIPYGSYVGSKESDKYHDPSCYWAQQINPSNMLIFSSRSEAEARGYIPCKVCLPELQPDPEPEPEPEPEEYEYIASKNSEVFHRISCSYVDSIKESNKIFFRTRQEAINSGRRPCKRCKP
jgi:methylphosphotriester-DNA--protein-cysteine methyltransferase